MKLQKRKEMRNAFYLLFGRSLAKSLEGVATFFVMTLAIGLCKCWAQNPTAIEATRNSAIALEQHGDDSNAELAWQEVLKLNPKSAEAHAHIGLLEARQQHYKEAATSYRKALAFGPAIPAIRLNLGLALFKSGELKQALHEFQPLLATEPRDSSEGQRLVILVGMSFYGLRDYGEAVPYLKEAASQDPQNLELRLALAHSCLWSKQYPCVLDTYHEILSLNAESAEADMLAGEALDEMKEYDSAIRQFRAAAKVNPSEPDVHFGLGYLLWTQRQYEEAVREFHAELANNPDHAQALTYLADAQMKMDHPELAIPLFKKVEKIDSSLSLAHLDLGILYAEDGRKLDAVRELQTAERIAPEDVNVHWRLARLLRSIGKPDEAKSEFAKASSLNQATDDALLEKMSGSPSQQRPDAALVKK